ncbi:dihydrofolate reductase [Arcanobacterium phocae]|uniref:dihydrofolate reductase n=1 Tax=Arcanobacterium phocae TaxID=131112 RepID=UPI001C0EBC85|nr:dihydrofolate reductase [Arcanobacterium phocae]
MKIGAIWAQARNGAIGKNGDIPWHLPEDLARFRDLTMGCPVIMGRATWESLPPRVRPLPGRANIVVTRNPSYATPGAQIAATPREALTLARTQPADTAWVIGGEHLYRAMLVDCDFAVVTQIDIDVPDADAVGPAIPHDWHEYRSQQRSSRGGLSYHVSVYVSPSATVPLPAMTQFLPDEA